MTLASDTALLQKWAPVYIFHPDEENMPSSIEWYLERTALWDGNDNVIYSPVINGTRTDSSCLQDASLGERKLWTLNILGDQAQQTTTQAGNLSSAYCYAYLRPVLDANGVLLANDCAYWMFCPFNGNIFNITNFRLALAALTVVGTFSWLIPVVGPLLQVAIPAGSSIALLKTLNLDGLGLHEGDWEYVTVRVSADGNTMLGVFGSEHKSGSWTTSPTLQNGRPKIYVAKASHANYFEAGTFVRLAGMANDVTGDGQAWDTQNHIMNVGWDANAATALQFVGSPQQFDGGNGRPAVAANQNNQVVSVHKSGSNYFYNLGNLDSSGQTLTWWSENGKAGRRFDAGDSNPSIAMDDDGLVLSIHRSSGALWWNAGTFDTATNSILWWNTKGQKWGSSSSGDPAVAMDDSGNVIVAYLQSSGRCFQIGTIDVENQTITWQQPITPVQPSPSAMAIALNNDGVLVHAYQYNGSMYYSVAQFDPQAKTLTWGALDVQLATGTNPQVGVDEDNNVVLVSSLGGNLYYNTGEVDFVQDYNTGEVDFPIIKWANTVPIKYASANGCGTVALTNTAIVVEVHQDESDYYSQVGGVLIDAFDSWTPANQQWWTKYSGRWGKHGTQPLIEFGNDSVAEWEIGPTGPAYKGSWIAGPNVEFPTSDSTATAASALTAPTASVATKSTAPETATAPSPAAAAAK
jgi:hypothetical protein